MGLMDSLKHRVSTNMKVTQLMFMTHPAQIIPFCQSLSPADRAEVIKGIENTFKWQPVAQIAQALFPAQPTSNVAADAADLAKGGFVSGAVDLITMQSQPVQPQYGMTQAQQAALSYAWMVLKNMESSSVPSSTSSFPASAVSSDGGVTSTALYCGQCGTRRPEGANFCSRCGNRFA